MSKKIELIFYLKIFFLLFVVKSTIMKNIDSQKGSSARPRMEVIESYFIILISI